MSLKVCPSSVVRKSSMLYSISKLFKAIRRFEDLLCLLCDHLNVIVIADKAKSGWWRWRGYMENFSSERATSFHVKAFSGGGQGFGRFYTVQPFKFSAKLNEKGLLNLLSLLLLLSPFVSYFPWHWRLNVNVGMYRLLLLQQGNLKSGSHHLQWRLLKILWYAQRVWESLTQDRLSVTLKIFNSEIVRIIVKRFPVRVHLKRPRLYLIATIRY